MKRTIIAISGFLLSFSALATPPSDKLINEYLQVIRQEEITQGQISTLVESSAAYLSAAEKAELQQRLEAVMGWSGVKKDYVEFIRKIYSAEELKASMAFFKTPLGTSGAQKTLEFSNAVTMLVAKRSIEMEKKIAASRADNNKYTKELAAINVTEHQVNGKTYFTGELVNRGKNPVRGARVEVNLFLGDKFVDQYDSYISGLIPTRGSRYFKISCGCKDSPPAAHDSFKIYILDNEYDD